MRCLICNSQKTEKVANFKPYSDKPWFFNIFYCQNCTTKFVSKNNYFEYHDQLHQAKNGPYEYQSEIAEKVAKYITNGEIAEAEIYLKKLNFKFQYSIEFIKNLNNPKLSILEIGSSTGFLTAYFRSRGYNAYGYDISETAIKRAIDFFGNYYYSQFNKLKNQKFDIVIFLGLIGCLQNPPKDILSFNSLVQKGGYILFNYPNLKSLDYLNELWASTPPPDLNFLFNEKSINYLFSKKYSLKFHSNKNIYESSIKYTKKFFNQTKDIYPLSFNNFKRKTKYSFPFKLTRKFIEVLINLRILKLLPSEYGIFVLGKKYD